MDKIKTILEETLNEALIQIIISNPRKSQDISKIKIRPILLKEELVFQFSSFKNTQVFHENYTTSQSICRILDELASYKQMELKTETMECNVLVSKKGQVTIKKRQVGQANQKEVRDLNHNRKKKYLLEEGQVIPFLVDLGVQTKDGKIINAKYDKFKQLNRFVEFLDDVRKDLPKDRRISILDFGCGKSYLTFVTYYFYKILHNLDVEIIGLDLKEDVINHCNELKDKYGYTDMMFLNGDISEYNEREEVDMVITLHACDTATDYALYKAIKWNAKVILSVPCCQHEVNGQMEYKPMESILKYGLLKEKMSALITDGIRANLLEEMGYETDLLEFIDMEYTPKNILIRGVKKTKMRKKNKEQLDELLKQLKVDQTLYRLLKEDKLI